MDYTEKVISVAKETNEFLEDSIRKHQERLLSSIHKLEDRIVTLTKELKTTDKGLLVGPRVNLKQSQKIHKKLKILFEDTYGEEVKSTIRDFDKISKQVDRSFKELDISSNFTSVDIRTLDALKQSSWNIFNQFGFSAQQKIVDSLYHSIVAQVPYSDLVNTIRKTLSGYKDKKGNSMARYAELYANDATMVFHTEVSLKKAQDSGIKKFLYYGNIMSTTRNFCRERVGKTFSVDEIKSWDSLSWQGKSGSALTNRGGYNCRHSWVPVKVSKLDADTLESRVVDETQAPLKERRARKAFLMRGVPYTVEELRKLNLRDLKQLASGLGLNSFGLKKQTILEMVMEEQKKPKWSKRAATVLKEISQPAQSSRFAAKTSSELKKEMKEAETRIKEYTKRGAPGDGYRSWKYASKGYLHGETGRKAYVLHQEAFESRVQWYNSLSPEEKRSERRRLLKAMVKNSVQRYKYDRITRQRIYDVLEDGSNYMSYRLLGELERSGVKFDWKNVNGRAEWDFYTNKIKLFSTDGTESIAHELAHAVDSLMGSGGRGLPTGTITGFLWEDNGVYVGKSERTLVRKEFESVITGNVGEYVNGDGFYHKGNFLSSYEGRIYDTRKYQIQTPSVLSKTPESVVLPRVGDEFWSMNCERYSKAVSSAVNAYKSELDRLKKTLKDAESKLRKLTADSSARKTEVEAVKEWRRETREYLRDLTSAGEDEYVRKYLNMSSAWSKVRNQYPRFADFIQKFFQKLTADDMSVLENDPAYKYAKKFVGD